MTAAPAPPFATLLLTGAGGMIGRVLTPHLRGLCRRLVLTDLAEKLAGIDVPAGAECVPCDLADAPAMLALLRGVDAVVHMGGVSYEIAFEPILQANVRGLHNLYESARLAGTKRIVFASSNHVTGCYPQAQTVSPTDPPRPDGWYGLSKLWGEGVGSLYFDRYGIETVCLRIGTATAADAPPDRRALATWLSHRDLVALVAAALTAPGVGFLVAYGISRNTRRWWDTTAAWAKLGYAPQDDAERFAAQVEPIAPPPGSPQALAQGGVFVTIGPFPFPASPPAATPAP